MARILVVDDSATNRFILQIMLENLGLEVSCVSGGIDAVEHVKNNPVDLIFMDIQMPDLDGVLATKEIRCFERENNPSACIPIIAFSANAMKGEKARLIESGLSDYLSKPVVKEELISVVNLWLGCPAAASDNSSLELRKVL